MSDSMPALHLPSTFSVPSTDGVTLRVHDFGGIGTPVLAAHATGFNGLTWTPLVRALSGCHVVAPDFRAHGGSPVPRDADLDWERYGDDVLATIDASGWDRSDAESKPIGIGHSMGGAALLLAELRRPGTFAGLWVYEPIVFPHEVRSMTGSVDNLLSAGALRRRPSFSSRAEAFATYGSKPPMNNFTAEALAGYVEAGFTDEPDGSVQLACRPEDEARIYTTAATCTAFERLDEVACPVVVVRGVVDEFSPARIAGPAVDALPLGHLVAHDELSHFGPMEAPAELAGEIDTFITDLGA